MTESGIAVLSRQLGLPGVVGRVREDAGERLLQRERAEIGRHFAGPRRLVLPRNGLAQLAAAAIKKRPQVVGRPKVLAPACVGADRVGFHVEEASEDVLGEEQLHLPDVPEKPRERVGLRMQATRQVVIGYLVEPPRQARATLLEKGHVPVGYGLRHGDKRIGE